MNDRVPGSSWSNPIWYGKWRIYVNEYNYNGRYPYKFVHDDYDGAYDANDNRNGIATSIEDAKHCIDHWDDE